MNGDESRRILANPDQSRFILMDESRRIPSQCQRILMNPDESRPQSSKSNKKMEPPMSADAKTTTAQTESGAQTIPLRGALEHSVDAVDRAVASGQAINLDFTACTFLSVEGLEWLEELMLRAQS